MIVSAVLSLDVDRSVRFVQGDKSDYVGWTSSSDNSVRPFSFSKEAALSGEEGVDYVRRSDYARDMESKLPFLAVGWFRYAININQWAFGSANGDSVNIKDFLEVAFSNSEKNEQLSHFINSSFFSIGDSLFLLLRFRFSLSSDNDAYISIPLQLNKTHTVEVGWRCGLNDLIDVECIVDNRLRDRVSGRYHFTKDYTRIRLYGYKKARPIRIFLDDFSLSDRRLEPLPPMPVATEAEISDDGVTLSCQFPDTWNNRQKEHKGTRWIIFKDGDFQRPIYNAEEVDFSHLYKKSVPFKLDSGTYAWYCCFFNNDMIMSRASEPYLFTVGVPQISDFARISGVKVRKFVPVLSSLGVAGFGGEVASIGPGIWYDWRIKTVEKFEEKEIAYWIVSLSHESYTYGHPANKGGAYICSLNTVFNISMDTINRWRLFERTEEGTFKGTTVKRGIRGLMLDNTKGAFTIVPSSKYLQFRGRIPMEAKFGRWFLSAYAIDKNGINTNVYRQMMYVRRIESGNMVYLAVIFVALVISFQSVRWFRRNKQQSPQNGVIDEVFDKLKDTVGADVSKSLSLKEIALLNRFSVRLVHEALRRNGFKTLPAFINKMRMDKAAELLHSPAYSISEICFRLNYDDPDYFSRIFKSIHGVTPSEYRKRLNSPPFN